MNGGGDRGVGFDGVGYLMCGTVVTVKGTGCLDPSLNPALYAACNQSLPTPKKG
jgi:hypothetical protein